MNAFFALNYLLLFRTLCVCKIPSNKENESNRVYVCLRSVVNLNGWKMEKRVNTGNNGVVDDDGDDDDVNI